MQNMIGNTTDKTNAPHKLIIIYRQVSKFYKGIKTQFSKMIQLWGFLNTLIRFNKNLMDKKSDINDFYRYYDKSPKSFFRW